MAEQGLQARNDGKSALGNRAMASTPHTLATKAAIDMLRAGGNAVDAAIAANAMLAVVMPDQCGLGGDLFALIYSPDENGRVFGLNGGGGAPGNATLAEYQRRGLDQMPQQGPLSLTVPGAVDAWGALGKRWGRLSLGEQLAAAESIAQHGFEITPQLSQTIEASNALLAQSKRAASTFLPTDKALQPGDSLVQLQLAKTLRLLSTEGSRTFYEGDIARAVQNRDGLLNEADMRGHQSEWVAPIRGAYRGHSIITLPPNSPGLILLLILRQLEQHDLVSAGYLSPEYIQFCVEAVRSAITVGKRVIADPCFGANEWEAILSKDNVALPEVTREAQIALQGDTVSLCVLDEDGMGVSLIQSIYHDFGSGLFVDSCGLFLQNRGAALSLDARHPNCLEPKRRPAHTLIPTLVYNGTDLFMLLGTRGGDSQPQTQTQILTNVIDFGLDIQTAVEAPRWVWGGTTSARRIDGLVLERSFPSKTIRSKKPKRCLWPGWVAPRPSCLTKNAGHSLAARIPAEEDRRKDTDDGCQ